MDWIYGRGISSRRTFAMDAGTDRWMGSMDRWMYGWMDGYEWMDRMYIGYDTYGWMDVCM